MQRTGGIRRREKLVWAAAAAGVLVAFVCRRLLLEAAIHLVSGWAVAMAALPLMRVLEKKCKPGIAAWLSLFGVALVITLLMALLLPSLIAQARLLAALAPAAAQQAMQWLETVKGWLAGYGISAGGSLEQLLLTKGREWLGNAAPAVLGWAQRSVGDIGKWLLAPVFGFYFLKDRKSIGRWLLLLLPVACRGIVLQLLGEIRRETAGYVRGQLLLSLAVGGLTAVGLLLCGLPAWLLLGAAMGLLELIPYVGPLFGGALVLLFSLQGGTGQILWAMAVVVLVQQLESSWLSPKMMSEATRLHPLTVILSVLLGGSAAGITGILLAVPLVLCLRSAYRVWSLRRSEWARSIPAGVKER
ncbi:MAG: AI-2E family transporter [Clostridia bacterium]|nr:AI-2E family transporter [Clostridia bacterium]